MIIDQCPHCQTRYVQTEQRFKEELKIGEQEVWRVVRCQNPDCKKLILMERPADLSNVIRFPLGAYEIDDDVNVGQEIRDEFTEAGLSLRADCPKASMVMSRRVLQRMLKEQGCEQKLLVEAINYAKENGIIREKFQPLADEIREYGNLSAHPDDDQLKNATKESAEQILGFIRVLLDEFYVLPASADHLRKQRES